MVKPLTENYNHKYQHYNKNTDTPTQVQETRHRNTDKTKKLQKINNKNNVHTIISTITDTPGVLMQPWMIFNIVILFGDQKIQLTEATTQTLRVHLHLPNQFNLNLQNIEIQQDKMYFMLYLLYCRSTGSWCRHNVTK